MSGGSLDYAYTRIEDLAEQIAIRASTPRQIAFARHLRLVAKAAHDLEWVWSADKSPGQEDAALDAVLTPATIIEAAAERAEKALLDLRAALDIAATKSVQ